jgi:hypothetical protein
MKTQIRDSKILSGFTPKQFIEAYGTLKGVALAHLLGLSGKGCGKLATDISCYAWNLHTHQAHPNANVPLHDFSCGSYLDIANHIASQTPEVRKFITA